MSATALAVHLSRQWIPEGDAGVAMTVARIREIIRVSGLDLTVRDAAEEAVQYLQHDESAELDAIIGWIHGNVDYRRDPLDTELLQESPLLVARIRAGRRPQADCDDLSLLLLSMLRSIGITTDVQLFVIATQPDLIFDHILALAKINGRMERLDMTLAYSGGRPAPEYRAAMVAV